MRLLPKDPELGWTPYAWLIYLVSFLISPAFKRASALEWAFTLAGAIVFLALYFRGFWYRDLRVLWYAGGILLLGVLFSPFNWGASSFFVYAAAFVAHSGPPRRAWTLVGVILAVLGLEAWLVDLSPYVWIPGVLFSLLIGGIGVHDAEVRRTNAKLRMAQQEVERLAQTAERERIARDLHDLLGHTLSMITLKSELAGKLIDRDPDRAGREIREVERISREALREVRSAIAGYRSEGLQAELARARLALESAGVKLEYFTQPVELEPARETVLALALREAVTNIIRHAKASTCRISLETVDEEVRLEVRDDGRGGQTPEGIGLSSMRERVEGLGGRLERRTDGGTVLLIALPRQAAPEVPAGVDIPGGAVA
jgi:two-component system, NarL family, sensor histidine kinase DesK